MCAPRRYIMATPLLRMLLRAWGPLLLLALLAGPAPGARAQDDEEEAAPQPTVYLLVGLGWCHNVEMTNLGNAKDNEACAELCKAKSGCQYFVYAPSYQFCWSSAATSPSCPTGFIADWRWEFYQVPTSASTPAVFVELWNTGYYSAVPDLDSLGDPAASYWVQQVDWVGNFMPFVNARVFHILFAARFTARRSRP